RPRSEGDWRATCVDEGSTAFGSRHARRFQPCLPPVRRNRGGRDLSGVQLGGSSPPAVILGLDPRIERSSALTPGRRAGGQLDPRVKPEDDGAGVAFSELADVARTPRAG